MANHPFRIVNVFTRGLEALTGNPLCVFENGADMTTTTMQALALQFNLSETTFILPSSKANARVRIFTPNYEMPFAGHPTLGTAHICRDLGLGGDSLTLDMQAGSIPVTATGDRWTLTALTPTWRELDVPLAAVASALNLTESDIAARPLWVNTGTEQLIVPLRSVDAVRRTVPKATELQAIRGELGRGMAYVFAESDAGSSGISTTEARFFFRQGGAVLEDPATGSATANFGGWCVAMQRALPLTVHISQGAMVGRPSALFLEIDSERTIRVSGNVVEFGRGMISI